MHLTPGFLGLFHVASCQPGSIMHTASVYSFLAVQLLNTSVHNYPTFLCRQLVGKSAPFVCCVAGKEVRQHGVTVVLGQGLDSGGAMYKAAERVWLSSWRSAR